MFLYYWLYTFKMNMFLTDWMVFASKEDWNGCKKGIRLNYHLKFLFYCLCHDFYWYLKQNHRFSSFHRLGRIVVTKQKRIFNFFVLFPFEFPCISLQLIQQLISCILKEKLFLSLFFRKKCNQHPPPSFF